MQDHNERLRGNISDQALTKTEIVISKLNPEVQDFIPKNIQYTNVPSNHSVGHNTLEDVSKKHSPKLLKKLFKAWNNNAAHLNSTYYHKTGQNGAGVSGRVNPKETQTIDLDRQKLMQDKIGTITKLKEKIINIPKDSSFDKRKDRNVAIAALIKANTGPAIVTNLLSDSSSLQPTTLRPPSYFQQQDQEVLATHPRTGTSSPTVLEENKSDDVTDVTLIDEKVEPKTEVTPSRTPVDPYMQESVKKVNNWFNSSTKPKQKLAELVQGPIIYKKKDVPKQNSPISNSSKGKSPVMTTPSFVFSKYAQELSEKYEERIQLNQAKEPPLDIWAKLERDLKLKDAEILKKRREALRNNETMRDS